MHICAQQDSPVPTGATVSFTCGAIGRYLVIMLEYTERLTMCEVQVFAGMTNTFTLKLDMNMVFCVHYTQGHKAQANYHSG